MLALVLLIAGSVGYVYFKGVDSQIVEEIGKLNLPVDSIQVDYEGKSLIFQDLDLQEILLPTAYQSDEHPLLVPEVSFSGVDWWKLYQHEDLVADTIWIRDVNFDFNEKLLDNIQFNSDFPVKTVKAKVLLVEGEQVNFQGNDRSVQLNDFLFKKIGVQLNLKKIKANDFIDNSSWESGTTHIVLKDSTVKVSLDSIAWSENHMDLSGVQIESKEASTGKSEIEVSGVDLLELIDNQSFVVEELEVKSLDNIDVRDGFSLLDLPALDGLQKCVIRKLRFEGNHMKADLRLGDVDIDVNLGHIEGNGHDINLLQNNWWEHLDVQIYDANVKGSDQWTALDLKKIQIAQNNITVEKGKIDLHNSSKLSFDFQKIILSKKNILKFMNTSTVQLDSIYASVGHVSLKQDKLNWEETLSDLQLPKSSIGQLRIDGEGLRVKLGSQPQMTGGSFSTTSRNIMIDSDGTLNEPHMEISISNIKLPSSRYFQTLKTNGIQYHNGRMYAKEVEFVVDRSRTKSGNTHYSVVVPAIDISVDDVSHYLEQAVMKSDELIISDAVIKIEMDENYGISNREKELLNEAIMQLDLPLELKHVHLKNANFTFSYRPKDDAEKSSIFFRKLNLHVRNIVNDPSKLQSNNLLTIDGTGRFMNASDFTIDAQFDLLDKSASYEYKIGLSTMEFSLVNNMLADLTGIKIKKGQMDKLLCNIKANKYKSKGNLDFYYRNLKVRYDKEKFIEKWNPVNFVLTRFIIVEDNRQEWEHEIGLIEVNRDPNRSMYQHMWESVFAGMKYVMTPSI